MELPVTKQWLVTPCTRENRVVHVLPLGDDMEHERSTDCPCGPRQEMVMGNDGVVGLVVLHHALDGRTPALDQLTEE